MVNTLRKATRLIGHFEFLSLSIALITTACIGSSDEIEVASVKSSATVPADFSDETFVTGISRPTAMAFAPDGRLFVAEQSGRLRVVSSSGVLRTTPFLTVSVSSVGERGLLGVAFDPNFATNR